jgi:NAD(P)-dependent dehydrogenase (short-subunit alcohol dehydrogenase family)
MLNLFKSSIYHLVSISLCSIQGTIVACCRSPSNSEGINSLVNSLSQEAADRVSIQPLDLEDQNSIEALANSIKSSHNRVDILLNVAGILGDGSTTPGPERSLRGMDREWTMKSFNVNYIGPIFLSQACAPMMKKKRDGGKSVIANLSARVGSISDNGLGGWISYRSSKAALNQATRTAAYELKRQGTYAITLHPGTTNTDLSKPFQANVREDRLFPVDFTASRMIDAIDACGDEHTGGFYDWSGKALPF